jgi:hypothetical protein
VLAKFIQDIKPSQQCRHREDNRRGWRSYRRECLHNGVPAVLAFRVASAGERGHAPMMALTGLGVKRLDVGAALPGAAMARAWRLVRRGWQGDSLLGFILHPQLRHGILKLSVDFFLLGGIAEDADGE